MDHQPHAPPSPLWRIALAIGLLLAVGMLFALWPFLAALSGALVSAVERYGAPIGIAVLLAAGAVLAGIVRAVWAWSWGIDAAARQARVVRLQNDLPISVDDVHASFEQHAHQSLQDFYAAKLAEAQRQFPLLTSYNQHIHNQDAPFHLPDGVTTVTTLPPAIPTFAQLLDGGKIGPDRPLILGFDAATGQPIEGGWRDLYSCGVGALQGAGKTWLLAFLLSQSAAAGGRLIVCDLHAGDEESLANRIPGLAPSFMCNIASTPAEIVTALAFANDKLERRKANNARWPIVLVCDEWTSLLRTAAGPALLPHIQNIAEQGRKYNVNALLAAQAWTKAASSDVRNQLTSHYLMRQRPDEARYQLGLRSDQLPDDIRSLPDATAYLLTVRGDLMRVIIPTMTPADIARVGAMIDAPASTSGAKFGFQLPTGPLTPPVATRLPDGSHMVASTNQATTPTERLKTASPEATRAAALFLDGKTPAEIVLELRGVKSSAGRPYQTALDEVLKLIREGVAQ